MLVTTTTRINVGCGDFPMPGWVNIDESASVTADLRTHVPPLPYPDASVDEIYAGHFLEHLDPAEAEQFLAECWRCLQPGGTLGIVVPDTREIMRRYVAQTTDRVEWPAGSYRLVADLDDMCAMFLYSTLQESPHRWSYDLDTLGRLLERHGFRLIGEIDRVSDARIPVGAWYQCGWDAVKP